MKFPPFKLGLWSVILSQWVPFWLIFCDLAHETLTNHDVVVLEFEYEPDTSSWEPSLAPSSFVAPSIQTTMPLPATSDAHRKEVNGPSTKLWWILLFAFCSYELGASDVDDVSCRREALGDECTYNNTALVASFVTKPSRPNGREDRIKCG